MSCIKKTITAFVLETDEKLKIYLKKNKNINFQKLNELIKKITNLMPRFLK